MSLSPLPILSLLLLFVCSLATEWDDESCYSNEKASILQVNIYVMIEDRPCKVVEKKSDDGGIHVVAVDIFTGAKKEATFQPNDTLRFPTIKYENFILMSIGKDGFCRLSNFEHEKSNLKVPDNDLGNKIKEANKTGKQVSVTVLSQCDGEELAEQAIVSFKIDQ